MGPGGHPGSERRRRQWQRCACPGRSARPISSELPAVGRERGTAERIRKKIETYNFEITNDISVDITVSIGIASYPYTSMNIDSLIEDADKALYEAKRIGRNSVVMYKNKD